MAVEHKRRTRLLITTVSCAISLFVAGRQGISSGSTKQEQVHQYKNCICSCRLVVPRASPKSAEHSEFRVTTAHAKPVQKSTHFLHQYMSPFTMLPSVLFYKEGLYIFMQHSSKHWCGSPFTGSPHHHLVRVGVNTSILILIVSILLYFLQASLIVYAIWQFALK
jgi:hypothetical protein